MRAFCPLDWGQDRPNADERTRTSTWLPRHGPEPCRQAPDASAGVRRVRFAGVRGRIGPIGRRNCRQTVVTGHPTMDWTMPLGVASWVLEVAGSRPIRRSLETAACFRRHADPRTNDGRSRHARRLREPRPADGVAAAAAPTSQAATAPQSTDVRIFSAVSPSPRAKTGNAGRGASSRHAPKRGGASPGTGPGAGVEWLGRLAVFGACLTETRGGPGHLQTRAQGSSPPVGDISAFAATSSTTRGNSRLQDRDCGGRVRH